MCKCVVGERKYVLFERAWRITPIYTDGQWCLEHHTYRTIRRFELGDAATSSCPISRDCISRRRAPFAGCMLSPNPVSVLISYEAYYDAEPTRQCIFEVEQMPPCSKSCVFTTNSSCDDGGLSRWATLTDWLQALRSLIQIPSWRVDRIL